MLNKGDVKMPLPQSVPIAFWMLVCFGALFIGIAVNRRDTKVSLGGRILVPLVGAVVIGLAVYNLLSLNPIPTNSTAQTVETGATNEAGTDPLTYVRVGEGLVIDCRAGKVEGTGVGNGPGLAIARLLDNYGRHSFALLAPQDIANNDNVEVVGVYHGKIHIATIVRRWVRRDKLSP